jgi:hypothetical protein
MSQIWDPIGDANNVVAMAAISGKLFAATNDNQLWWRDPVGVNVNWDPIGYANNVVAMTAISGKLFAATNDNQLWWRDPVAGLVNGTIARESSAAAVYGLFDGRKVLIPTPSALFAMGHTWADVRVVPDGSLSDFPETRIVSLSPTPGSLVFPPPNNANPPDYGRHFVISGVRGSIRIVSQGHELSIAELRGWLRPVPPGYLINTESGWDDFHYTLELDSSWAVSQGIDLNQVLKVGNILEYPVDAAGPDDYRQISNPLIGLEINGWKPGNDLNVARPDDWHFPQDGSVAGQDFLTAFGLPETRWPFDPRFQQVSDNSWPYARIVGSLIADKEHGGPGGVTVAERAWRAGMPNEAGEAPTRAVEIHPPDYIEILADQPRSETLRGVAVVAGTGAFESAEQELTARIAPPGPRPSPDHGITIIELVGPETDLSTIVGGNESLSGALLQSTYYDIRLWIKVRRTGIGGRPGRFKAIYRVFWDIPGLPRPTGWWSRSGTLSLSPPDRIDYTITPNAVGSDAVEFVLEAGPGITWRKVLTIADGLGGSWDIVTQDLQISDRNGLYLYQLPAGTLAFWKLRPLNIMAHVTTLGDLDQLAPGTRVTFRWITD